MSIRLDSTTEHLASNGKGSLPSLQDLFQEQFNESLPQVLDLGSWTSGRNLAEEYRRIEKEVAEAVEQESQQQKTLREQIHPLLNQGEDAPPGAGVHSVSVDEIIATQRELLFRGAVEACDGTNHTHDSLALTLYQVGICLVSYKGCEDSWQMKLYRRDIRMRNPDPVEEVLDLLERRSRRKGLHDSSRDVLSELARRGLMSYAERAVLAEKSQARWRMGHGSPAPLELIGASFTDLMLASVRVIRRLIDHERFVFIASEPADRGLLMIGQSLYPMEYAIIGTLRDRIYPHLENWRPSAPATLSTLWDGVALTPQQWVQRFRDDIAPKVVYGLYRATRLAPPQLFYAHVDHAHVAARIALADSSLLEERGFPMLIDLADRQCRILYGGGSLQELANSAYASVGAPFRYGSERSTREELL